MPSLKHLPRNLARVSAGTLSSILYGTDIGLANVWSGHSLLRRCQQSSSRGPVLPRSTEASNELHATGYALLKNFYDSTLLNQITSKLSWMMTDNRYSRPRDLAIIHGVEHASRAMRNPLKTLPELAQLVSPEFVNILETYYRSNARVVGVQMFRNSHVNLAATKAKEIFSSQWHMDRQHSAYVQLMVYFSDNVTRETGAYATHDIAHTKTLVRSGYLARGYVVGPAARMINDEKQIRYFEGGIGDAMLTNNTLCMHRAGVPKPGASRDAIMFHFEPAEKPMPADWPNELEPLPGDDSFVVRRDRPVYNVSSDRLHPAVLAHETKLKVEMAAAARSEEDKDTTS